MKNKSVQLTPDESLRADNEIKALNLELRHGAMTTFISDDAPPELISQWLDNVTRYEEQYARAEQVTIHEFIGRPVLRPVEALKNDAFETEIARLQAILEEHAVMSDRPAHLSPKGYYRFLTQDFMQHQMTNCAVPGMMHVFPYDEFHRDGPEFIEAHVGDFIQDLMNLDRAYEGVWLSEHLRDDENEITKTEALARINAFRSAYSKIELGAFSPINLEVTDSGMYFLFQGEWHGTPVAKPGKREHHEGLGVVQVAFEDEDWLVQGIMMPGFKF